MEYMNRLSIKGLFRDYMKNSGLFKSGKLVATLFDYLMTSGYERVCDEETITELKKVHALLIQKKII